MEKRVRLEQVNDATNTFKAYEVSLTQTPAGWTVSGWNGRIGKPLKEQPKATGLMLTDAQEVFDKLVQTQVKKGYRPVGDAAQMVTVPEGAESDPDMVPALLTAIGELDPETLDGDDWLVQEKHDGENRPIRVTADEISFANRKGQRVPGTKAVSDVLSKVTAKVGPMLLNTEDMGPDGVVVVDIVEGLGVTRSSSFSKRNEALARLWAELDEDGPVKVDIAIPLSEFRAKGAEAGLIGKNAEGFVLKRGDAAYAPGRTDNPKKAIMLKLKFVEDATFRISEGREVGKRSVGLESWDEKNKVWVPKGNVTIPVNATIPAVGTFADVRYLYAYENGSVYQPVWKGPRTGVGPADCALSKLKNKTEAAASQDYDTPGL